MMMASWDDTHTVKQVKNVQVSETVQLSIIDLIEGLGGEIVDGTEERHVDIRIDSNETGKFIDQTIAGGRSIKMDPVCDQSDLSIQESDMDDELVALQNWLLQPTEYRLVRNCWTCRYQITCGGACHFNDEIPASGTDEN